MIYDIGGHIAEPGPGGTWRLTPKPGTRDPVPEVPAVTPGELVQAIRAAVSQHEPAGGGQWYVDGLCIDCDAGEFWDVVLRAACEQAGAGITVEPRVLRDVTLLSWGPDPGYAPPWPGTGVQPGQVLPGHPDVAHPAAWGEHPRDCDCGDCP